MNDPYLIGMLILALVGWAHAVWRAFRSDRETAAALSRAEAAEARVRELEDL